MAAQALGNPLGNPLALSKTTAGIGQILSFYNNPGSQWLPCDGSSQLVSSYPQLAAISGNSPMGVATTRTTSIVSPTSVVDMAATPDGQTMLTTHSGSTTVYRSTNFGASWQSGPTAPSGSGYLLYAGNNIWTISNSSGYYYSNNLAAWTLALGSVVNYAWQFARGANLQGVVLMAMLNTTDGTTVRIYRSTDYGVSYAVAATIASVGDVRQITFDGVGNWYFGTANGNVYKSSDNGSNWTLLPKPGSISSCGGLSAQGSTVVICESSSNGEASISRDGGQTWTLFLQSVSLSQLDSVKSTSFGLWAISSGTNSGLIYVTTNNWASYYIFSGSGVTSQSSMTISENGIYVVNGSEFRASEYVASTFYLPRLTPPKAGANYFIKAR